MKGEVEIYSGDHLVTKMNIYVLIEYCMFFNGYLKPIISDYEVHIDGNKVEKPEHFDDE